jgi:hypothetical protein
MNKPSLFLALMATLSSLAPSFAGAPPPPADTAPAPC